MTTQGTANTAEALTAADFAEILATTLGLAAEAHVRVGVRNAPPTPLRGAGLMIFIPGLEITDAGQIRTTVRNEAPHPARPENPS